MQGSRQQAFNEGLPLNSGGPPPPGADPVGTRKHASDPVLGPEEYRTRPGKEGAHLVILLGLEVSLRPVPSLGIPREWHPFSAKERPGVKAEDFTCMCEHDAPFGSTTYISGIIHVSGTNNMLKILFALYLYSL